MESMASMCSFLVKIGVSLWKGLNLMSTYLGKAPNCKLGSVRSNIASWNCLVKNRISCQKTTLPFFIIHIFFPNTGWVVLQFVEFALSLPIFALLAGSGPLLFTAVAGLAALAPGAPLRPLRPHLLDTAVPHLHILAEVTGIVILIVANVSMAKQLILSAILEPMRHSKQCKWWMDLR